MRSLVEYVDHSADLFDAPMRADELVLVEDEVERTLDRLRLRLGLCVTCTSESSRA